MSIIIKKKPKYNKKKVLIRALFLIFVYFFSFFMLYAFFGHRSSEFELITPQDGSEIVYDNEGDKFLAEEKYADAIVYFQRILNENPEDFFAMNRIGQGYYKIGDVDKAKFYLFRSKELAPRYTDTYIKLVHIYIDQGDLLSAENMIDIIPTQSKGEFVAKGKILVELAKHDGDLENRIIHYTRAISYFKNYDASLTRITTDKLVDTYFRLAEHYKEVNDAESARVVLKNISKYRNDCITHNALALGYMNLDDELLIKHIQRAVNISKSQEEKRLTKQNLIDLKYYFEKKGNIQNLTLMSSFMLALNESSILVDENYTNFAIKDDRFDFIYERDDLFSEVTFSVQNKTDKNVNYLEARMAIYFVPERVIDVQDVRIAFRDLPVPANGVSNPVTIRLDKKLNPYKVKKYTIALSLSEDGKNWQLYRLYSLKGSEDKIAK